MDFEVHLEDTGGLANIKGRAWSVSPDEVLSGEVVAKEVIVIKETDDLRP